ncbi:hypothetical protein TEA_008000 [Camellia sinensis var. sinensis]|uniref:4-hydroxy-4-methyl-2-oxoglutarate aldolase n=1 Tax=Camellia sinensis var. sinensis TaxID=542762 RepID=A0A4V6RY21_CAMSN|nr:hypothetical protein TEA_008000 [Camellia sinensis var. sinensis]
MASLVTVEACDSNVALVSSGDLRCLQPIFQIYVRELLETRGEGRVLVIDGGGSKRCALLGGNLGQSAQNMGWAGIVINGCVKDVDEINGSDIGVRALASHPHRIRKGLAKSMLPFILQGL